MFPTTMAMKRLAFMLLLSAIIHPTAFAQCAGVTSCAAASCNASDVQNALNSINTDGTTLTIPSCSAGVNWSSSVTYNQTNSTIIIGASGPTGYNAQGSPTGFTDQTVILDNVNHASGDPATFQINAASGKSFRLSGITFETGASGGSSNTGPIRVSGSLSSIRIDHNHFSGLSYVSLLINGDHLFGVFDHNQVDLAAGSSFQGIWFWADNWDGDSNGDGSWADPTNLGTNQFMFAENNTFNGGGTGANDCTHGGRYVWRYNTMNDNIAIQTHPTGGSGRARGCRAWEVYNNNFVGSNSSPEYNVYFLSAGTGVMWGNSAPAGYEQFVSAHNVRSDNSDYSQTATPNGWGYCGTAFDGTGSGWDQNSSSSTGYACIDQVGRGVGQLLSGQFPSAVNTATNTMSWPNQAQEPVYEWMDTWTAVPGYGYGFWNVSEGPSVIVQNQDYYLWCNSSSPTGCTSYDGTSGVGSGLLAARPSTCTAKTGYFATDTSTLYQCGSGNTWAAFYTPYTYPHPLTQGTPVAPLPPTDLKAVVN